MLASKYDGFVAAGHLLPADRASPYPAADDREVWSKVPRDWAAPWLEFAREHEHYAWPALTMAKYAAFRKEGDLLAYLKLFWERRSILGGFVIAECLEGEGRYIERILDGLFAVCEETTWVVPHHNTHVKTGAECLPDAADDEVELAGSETGALLAWTMFLLGAGLDAISPRIRERVLREVRRRLIGPYLDRDDYWWMGFAPAAHVNNWNPWCNNNMLTVFLLLEPEGAARNDGIRKIMRSLDEYLRRYPADGCCEEGPMYWGAAGGGLYNCLEQLYAASDGEIDIYAERIVSEMGKYLYRVHIAGDYYVDFADGDARVDVGGAPYGFGKRIGDPRLTALSLAAKPKPPRLLNWFSAGAVLNELFTAEEKAVRLLRATREPDESGGGVREAWLPVSQVMTAREREGTSQGLYLAAKGGSNFEPHNHNDVGSFIVYADGCPALIDLGTESYRAQTFSPTRYELWYLKSSYHNLPTVGGCVQQAGESFRASGVSCVLDDSAATLGMDIAGAYPAEAGIRSWRRTCRLVRASAPDGADAYVEIVDDFALERETGQVEYSLMTPCAPLAQESGTIRLEYAPGRRLLLRYDADALEARVEEIPLTDERLIANWGERVFRIVLAERFPVREGVRTLRISFDSKA